MKFIFHDSRITDGMNTRQVATLLKIAHEETNQMIFSTEFDEIINYNIVLNLSDKSDAEKLLGMQIDLNYYN